MKGTLDARDIKITRALLPGFDEILTTEALLFVASLERRFGARRLELLRARAERQAAFDRGERPGFLSETASVRDGSWTVAPTLKDLEDRRVEITGPVGRKMIINALNSDANVFMADFEDSTAPTWSNVVQGQINLRDAVERTIEFVSPSGKHYALGPNPATLMVRPRGLHLVEKHVLVDGNAVSASFFDFALYFFHNAGRLLESGTGPYFYLPKLESHLEARLWNDVFVFAQDALGIPLGTIKATVLIETITAAFEMDEILHELQEHSAGLNCGRWDYIFSVIKKFRSDPDFVMPDRSLVTMTSHFLRSYSRLLIQTCHRREAHAMGGMAAQIPIKADTEANDAAMTKVRDDKLREVRDGHDGTWVAHPGLIPVASKVFDEGMSGPNQIGLDRPNGEAITARDLLVVPKPEGRITESGLRTNLRVGLEYLASWLAGSGCVPINHLMEDAATVEIGRAQVWQWIRHPNGILDDGRNVTVELVRTVLQEELSGLKTELDEKIHGKCELAATILDDLTTADDFAEFLTLSAYEYL